MTRKNRGPDRDRAEEIAIHGLAFLAEEVGRLGRFLALTGAGPETLARARDEPEVLASVLEYLLGDEPLLLEFSGEADVDPETIQAAWDLLVYEGMKRKRPL